MFNLINLSLSQLNYFYFYLGFSYKFSNRFLLKYFLGNYYNISIINLNFTLFFLKSSLNILLNVLLKNGKILVFSNNINSKILYLFKFFKINYCIKKWHPGMLTRFKNIIKLFRINKKKKNFFLFSIPDLVLIISFFDNYYSIIHLSKEIKKLLIPSIKLIDSIHNPMNSDYFILLNIKNLYSNLFYLNILYQIILKSIILKKKKFFKKIIFFLFKNSKK